MIKEITEETELDRKYEVYREVQMETPDGQTVTVLQLSETVYLGQLNDEILQLEEQLSSIQSRLTERNSLLAEINNL